MLPWGLAFSYFPGGHAQEGLGKGVCVFLCDLTEAIWPPQPPTTGVRPGPLKAAGNWMVIGDLPQVCLTVGPECP